jgi:CheY-like chemotaxis protein
MAEKQAQILVVDDREQNRYVLCRVLKQANYESLEAGSGAEALALAATLPDVIILDVSLPDISGFDVRRRIKSDPQTSQISVLQISASMISSDHKTKGQGTSGMERHDDAQSKARNDYEGERSVSCFCELTRELNKLEWRLQPIDENSQTEESCLTGELEQSNEPSHALSPVLLFLRRVVRLPGMSESVP